jgi:D-alanine-D-alanine ligase
LDDINSHKDWLSRHLPVIVKPSREGTSKGLSKESLCHNLTQVKTRTGWVLNTYHQPVLIEQFIKGYEFTVAIAGNNPPEVLPPVQVSIKGEPDLGEEFYTHARVESSEIKYICPAKGLSSALEKKIRKLALESYNILGCLDVGRIDIRVDYGERVYFLECNPLPNLGHLDVFPLVAKVTGRTYEELIYLIIQSGLKRYGLL